MRCDRDGVQVVSEWDVGSSQETHEQPVRDQLERAARDLWSMVVELGDDYAVFMDRRHLSTRVQRTPDGEYRVSWEQEDGSWTDHAGAFENLREAAFHGYQGPHECG